MQIAEGIRKEWEGVNNSELNKTIIVVRWSLPKQIYQGSLNLTPVDALWNNSNITVYGN